MLLKKSAANNVCTDDDATSGTNFDVLPPDACGTLRATFLFRFDGGVGVASSPVVNAFAIPCVAGLQANKNEFLINVQSCADVHSQHNSIHH